MAYCKRAFTIDEQITRLEKRGLVIQDRARTVHDLAHKNYYRLRAYWLPFEEHVGLNADSRFRLGTTWEQVMELYCFDSALRTLMMDGIEQVETSMRTRWAHVLALKYGPHAHEASAIFYDQVQHQELLAKLKGDYDNSREVFAAHHRRKYPELHTPPIWASCELMTLGQLSKWYAALAQRQDRQEIARVYQVDEEVLRSFLHHLSNVRNICAHHGRLWNRKITVTMKLPRKGKLHCVFNPQQPDKAYNTLAMLWHLLQLIDPAFGWKKKLQALLAAYPGIAQSTMGFPQNWAETWIEP